jgi:hypothetical protein
MKAMLDFFGNWFPPRHIAYGTLFGAPLLNDGLVLSRRDYTYTEPTIVYNSGGCGVCVGVGGGGVCVCVWGGGGFWAGRERVCNGGEVCLVEVLTVEMQQSASRA